MVVAKWVGVGVVAMGLTGCGADPASQTESTAQRPSDEQIAALRATLGETTCGTTAADATIVNGVNIARSPTAQYGHPTCANGFVVDETGVYKGQGLFAQSNPTALFNLFCGFSWSYVSVWQKQGSSYVNIGSTLKFGTLNFNVFAPQNDNCDAAAAIAAPADGDYKIIGAAGSLFTGYSVVDVG